MGLAGRRATQTGVALLLGVLVLLLGSRPAAAQNYTRLRSGVQLPPSWKVDNVTEAKELQGLLQKLPQISGSVRAQQQLMFLSANSRSKLNNLTGTADVWLRNRTDTQLEQLFEAIRSENFVRTMAIASVFTQLPKCFSSCNVMASLETLQTDDLVRLASLPLFEDRYQKMTNVTFLQLLQQLYSFGLTQVPQRTCVLTGANTSDISQLPSTDPVAAAAAAQRANSLAALSLGTAASSTGSSSSAGPVVAPVRYVATSYDRAISSSGMVSPISGRHRKRSLLERLAGASRSLLHLDHQEVAAAVVQEVTRGPGSAPSHLTRKLMQQTVTGPNTPDASLAPIVTKFVDGLVLQNAPSSGGSSGAQQVWVANPAAQSPSSNVQQLSGVSPGLPTQAGFFDTRAVAGGCTESMGVWPYVDTAVASAGLSGGIGGSGSGISGLVGGSSSGGGSGTGGYSNVVASENPIVQPQNCSNGIWNGTFCVPCPPGAVVGGNSSMCECPLGTAWDATSQSCLAATAAAAGPCINGTFPNGTACNDPPPGVNGTLPSPSPSPGPLANGSLPLNVSIGGQGLVLNATLPRRRRRSFNVSANALPILPTAVLGSNTTAAPSPAPVDQNGTVLAGPPLPVGNSTVPLPPQPQPSPAPGSSNSSQILPPGTGSIQPVSPSPAAPAVPSPAPAGPAANITQLLPAGNAPQQISGPRLPGTTGNAAVPAQEAPLSDLMATMRGNPTPRTAVAPPAVATPSVVDVVSSPSPTPAPVVPAASPAPPVTLVPPAVVPPAPAAPAPSPPATAVVQPALVAPVTPTAPVAVQQPTVVAPVTPVATTPVVQQPVTPVTPVATTPVTPVVQQPVTPLAPVVLPTPAPAPVPVPVVKPVEAPPVNCVGSWIDSGPCSATCADVPGTKTQVYQITTPAANGGAQCEAAAGATKQVPCTNPTPCPKPVACVGSWIDSGACSATCADVPGTKTQVYQITTPAANGGAACEAAAGATKQVPCTNPTPCPKPVACVGSWIDSGACSATCADTPGTKTQVYQITTPAANGGAACEAAAGATKQVPCTNPTPCPKAPVVTAPVATPPAVPPPAVPTTPAVTPTTVTTPAVTAPVATVPAVHRRKP